jgi:hypothetical protein
VLSLSSKSAFEKGALISLSALDRWREPEGGRESPGPLTDSRFLARYAPSQRFSLAAAAAAKSALVPLTSSHLRPGPKLARTDLLVVNRLALELERGFVAPFPRDGDGQFGGMGGELGYCQAFELGGASRGERGGQSGGVTRREDGGVGLGGTYGIWLWLLCVFAARSFVGFALCSGFFGCHLRGREVGESKRAEAVSATPRTPPFLSLSYPPRPTFTSSAQLIFYQHQLIRLAAAPDGLAQPDARLARSVRAAISSCRLNLHLTSPACRRSIVTLVTLAGTYLAYLTFLRPRLSPLRVVPGPKPDSFWSGNLARIVDEEPGIAHTEWCDKYDGVVRYSGMFGVSSAFNRTTTSLGEDSESDPELTLMLRAQEDRLVFTDPVALNYILLTRSYDYPKPNEVRGSLSRILGKGVLFAEGMEFRASASASSVRVEC